MKRDLRIKMHPGATRAEMTEEMWKAAIRHKSETIDALVRVLRDVQGFADTSDVAYLWSEKGEHSPYHAAMRDMRAMLRRLDRESDLSRQWTAD